MIYILGTCSDLQSSKSSDLTENSSGICVDLICDTSKKSRNKDLNENENNDINVNIETENKNSDTQNHTADDDQSISKNETSYSTKHNNCNQNIDDVYSRNESPDPNMLDNKSINSMRVEDDRMSQVSSTTSSGVSSVSSESSGRRRKHGAKSALCLNGVSGSSVYKHKNSFNKITPAKNILIRSKSYADIKQWKEKADGSSQRPQSGKSQNRIRGFSPSRLSNAEKISLENEMRLSSTVNGVPMVRRNSNNKLVSRNSMRNLLQSDKNKENKKSTQEKKPVTKHTSQLMKANSSSNLVNANTSNIPDRVISAAINRVQSNLGLPNSVQDPATGKQNQKSQLTPNSSHTKKTSQQQKTNPSEASEIAEIDSSSDAESAVTATTVTTVTTPSSSEAKGPVSLSDLKVPLSRPKEVPDRPSSASETTDKSNNNGNVTTTSNNSNGVLREQGPNFLAELEGERLSLYGTGALKCTELPWDRAAAAVASTARFQYVNFDDVVDVFHRLRVRFPRLEHFIFVETHLAKCSQLNALAELHQVQFQFLLLLRRSRLC